MDSVDKKERLIKLNDLLRKQGIGGKIVYTRGVSALNKEDVFKLYTLIRNFNDFNESNDPYQEHDFGAVDFKREKYYWKIDYYNLEEQAHSQDPSNPNITSRVLTIMRSDEY
ncbi:MAG: DUF3768 domain-containing protein [Alphaproteobacteria bacterium]|jgi:hypothetical protein|nr:DUF3768 domain-containing protein [Alphaproteobacteria bacterium]